MLLLKLHSTILHIYPCILLIIQGGMVFVDQSVTEKLFQWNSNNAPGYHAIANVFQQIIAYFYNCETFPPQTIYDIQSSSLCMMLSCTHVFFKLITAVLDDVIQRWPCVFTQQTSTIKDKPEVKLIVFM